MRKITSLLLAVVMVFSMATNAFALSFVPELSSNEVKAGETVTLTLSMDEDKADLTSLECYIYFDTTLFDVTGGAKGEVNSHLNLVHGNVGTDKNGKNYVNVNYVDFYSVGNPVYAGELYTLTFTAKEDLTAEQATQFTLVSKGALDNQFQDVEVGLTADVLDVTIKPAEPEKIPVTSVGLSETAIEMALNSGIKQLYATVTPDNATNKIVTWTSSDENVVTVVDGGNNMCIVYTAGAGEAVITATADGVSATCTVTVYDPATQFPYTLSVNGEDLEVTPNGTTSSCLFGNQSLFDVTVPADATEMLITYDGDSMTVMDDSSGSPNILAQNVAEYTLDLTQGYAEIHLAENNVHRHVRINVAEPEKIPVTGVTLSVSEYTLDAIGGEFVLVATITPSNATNQEVVWATSDANVATVENGYIKAVGGGNCEITATVDGVTATCVVTVIDPRETFPFSISVNGEDLEATYVGTEKCNTSGERALYEVTVPADATSMMIYYDGEAMIIQNEADKAKLAQKVTEYEVDLTAGYEKLCIREDNRIRYHLAINVAEPETPAVSITLDKTELELSSFAGEYYFTLTVTGADKADVVWASTNEDVAMIYAMPKYDMYMVQGMGPGECDITATVGGVTATCHVTVVDPVLDSFPYTITVDGTDVEAVADGTEMCDYGPRLYKYVVTVPADAKIMHLSYDNESAYILPDHGDEYLLEGGVDCDVDLTKGYKVLDLWDAEDNLMIHLHIEYAEPVAPGYTVTMSKDVEAVVGGDVSIPVTVGHTDDVTKYNAFDFTFTYDPAILELTSTQIKGMTVTDNNGTVHVERYGTDLNVGDVALTLTFKAIANGQTNVKVTSAKVDISASALNQDAPDASVIDNITLVAVTGFTVSLPAEFTGESSAMPGENYTFEAKDKNYNYTFDGSTMDGQPVTIKDNDDGTFTIENVTGNIVIKTVPTGKTFSVTLGEDMTGETSAKYMTPYTATLTKKDGFTYNIKVTIGGKDYTGFTYDASTGLITIPGEAITGEIVFNSNKTAKTPDKHSIEFTGEYGDIAEGTLMEVENGKDYILTINKVLGYKYTVTATMAGEPAEVIDNGDGTYTIKNVTGDLVITIAKEYDLAVEVGEYVTLNGKTMFLVTATATVDEGKVLSYNGTAMFYSNQYNAWSFLVITEGTLSVDDAKALITLNEGTKVELSQTYNVNETANNTVDINDAQLVFDMYNNEYQDIDTVGMQKFLKADVNGDKKIDVNDAAAIVAQIVAAK